MNKHFLAILGAPNDSMGKLSKIANDRCFKALTLFENQSFDGFILTGGFGENFNTSDSPHFSYQQAFLENNGIDNSTKFYTVMSSNTFEDITGIFDVCKIRDIKNITIITSDFHAPRVNILLRVLSETKPYSINTYIDICHTQTTLENMRLFLNHEVSAIEFISSHNDIR